MTRIRGDGAREENVSPLPSLDLAQNFFYRITPTLVYPVINHDKDSGDGALEEYLSPLPRLVLA